MPGIIESLEAEDEAFLSCTTYSVGERFAGWRLDRFLSEQIPKLSRNRVQAAIGERVRVSWSDKVKPGMRVVPGEKVFVGFPRLYEVPENHQFPILFEDEELLVIEKPPGLVVHPTNDCRLNSLSEILKRQRGLEKIHLLHRLDRETSGLLMIAKTEDLAVGGMRSLQRRSLTKIYLALVEESPRTSSGWIRNHIGKDQNSRVAVRRCVGKEGEAAETYFEKIHEFQSSSLLLLIPKTGRRHQLRVHCEHLGSPILGDPLYGKGDQHYLALIAGERDWQRMCLHAWAIRGRLGGREIAFEASWPDFLEDSTSLESCVRRALASFRKRENVEI